MQVRGQSGPRGCVSEVGVGDARPTQDAERFLHTLNCSGPPILPGGI